MYIGRVQTSKKQVRGVVSVVVVVVVFVFCGDPVLWIHLQQLAATKKGVDVSR
jgi:hypothetical protein